jgi:selenocysteine lyase/cysteine desulfurase
VVLDAVHYAPHGPIDVQALDCDYLVCSGYKVFAPHMGFAWCRKEAIDRLPTFREDFIPDVMPDKLEAGTYVYENVAGMDAAVGYLEGLSDAPAGASRTETIRSAMRRIAEYERVLSATLLDEVASLPGVIVHGIADRDRLGERVPTLCFNVAGRAASDIAEGLAAIDVGVRNGHMYSPRLMARMGLLPGGAVRASLVHYNTTTEIAAFGAALRRVIGK